MAQTLAVSIVIPAHNEADNLPRLLDELEAAVIPQLAQEVIIVDDGSSDETRMCLATASAKWRWLRTLRHDKQAGQSTALINGIIAAQGELIATLDGDGQNDPADISALLEAREGYGRIGKPLLIVGERQHRHDNWVRKVSSRIANKVRGYFLADYTPDTGCGLKLFQRSEFLDLPRFNHLHRFLPALFIRAGGEVISIRVTHRARDRGQSHYGVNNRLWVGIIDLFGVMWLQKRRISEKAVCLEEALSDNGKQE
tara:strand:- start:1295 stop:2059 length:765 start_codon:yes stop_codon:yes gene_type:complete